jgi:hypothetical protein
MGYVQDLYRLLGGTDLSQLDSLINSAKGWQTDEDAIRDLKQIGGYSYPYTPETGDNSVHGLRDVPVEFGGVPDLTWDQIRNVLNMIKKGCCDGGD